MHNDDPGFRFVLVHATDGEGDSIVEASGATSETLGAVRREEDRQGVADARPCPGPARVVGYSDGGLADVPRRELVDRIAAILDQKRPEVVVTFGPDGITGHLDHITIGEATPRRSCGWQGTAGQACGGSSTAGSDSW